MFKSLKLGLLVSTAILVTACGNDNQETESSAIESSAISSTENTTLVSFVFEEDEKAITDLTKEVEVEEGQTVLEALKGNFEVVDEGGLVTSIEGIEQNEAENKWWLYTINDEQPTVGAAEYILKDGDQVKWTLNGF